MIIILALLAAGGYFVYDNFIRPAPPVPPVAGGTPTPKPGTTSAPNDSRSSTAVAEPARAVDKPNFKLEDENRRAQQDVTKRIDQMPNLTPEQKNKLYSSVDRARGMGAILIVPFAEGKKTLGQSESQILVNAIQSAGIKKLTEDPTLVFVVLGYTDKKGDPKVNEKTSIDRAESVLATMRDKGGVANVMYAVGMGGAEVLNKETTGNNRLVEVWAVFP